MKNYKYIFSILSLIVLFSCQNSTKETIEDTPTTLNKENLTSVDGYWIMSDYIDSILKNKTIEKQTRKRMTWTAVILHIENDTLTYYGLILGNKKLRLNNNYDSLTVIKGMGEYQLSYNTGKDIIKAKSTKDYYESKDSLNYSFRRVNESEQRLINGIDNKPFFQKLEPNFYSVFIDSLISGDYKLLTDNSSIMKLETTGTLSGFKSYNKYSIHDYFGTLHPYRQEDAIIFEDTTIISDGTGPPENIGVYSWGFNGDTLTLTEMLTETYDSYYNGTVKYKFIKKSR
jgi:hypothetical protein